MPLTLTYLYQGNIKHFASKFTNIFGAQLSACSWFFEIDARSLTLLKRHFSRRSLLGDKKYFSYSKLQVFGTSDFLIIFSDYFIIVSCFLKSF